MKDISLIKLSCKFSIVLVALMFLVLPLFSFFVSANGSSSPIISNVFHNTSDTPIKISFSTNVESFGEVVYSIAGGDEQIAPFSSSNAQLDYDVELTNLEQGNVYIYKVKACTAPEVCSESNVDFFVFGEVNTPPPVDSIECPSYSRDRFVQIGGTTRSMSNISLYQDDSYKLKVQANEEGLFVLRAPLTSEPTTELKLVVEDVFGNQDETICVVSYDSTPPNLVVDSVPEMLDSLRADISLSVDKPVTLDIFRFDVGDLTPPGAPTELRTMNDPTSEEIAITWTAPETTDSAVQSYIIYRGNIPIASTSQTSYEDTEIISGRSYSYKVRAVDSECGLGAFSEVLDVQARTGTHYSPLPEEIQFLCPEVSPDINTIIQEDNLEFSGPLTLRDGRNKILIVVTDDFGNSAETEFEIEVDRTRPTLDTNLGDFSGGNVFTPYVTIRGDVSKPATVNITVNKGKVGERKYTDIDASSGTFSEQIDLARTWEALFDVGEDPESASAGIDFSSREWENEIEIVAIDNFGHVVTEVGTITYGLCAQGDGHDWQITIPSDSVTPNEIIPRHLLEGVAVLGFSIELEYRGSGEEPEIIETRVRPTSMSQFAARNYNFDWIKDSPIPVNRVGNYAYAQIRLQAQNPIPDGTLLENEQELAKTNEGRCYGSMLSFGAEGGLSDFGSPIDTGCVKLPMIIEVQYRSPDGGTLTQQECVDFSIMIDNRFDVRDVPLMAPALNASAWLLKKVADVADNLTARLQLPMKVSTIGCISTYALNFINMVGESRACVLNGALAYVNDFEFIRDGEGYVVDMTGLSDEDIQKAEKLQECFNAKVSTEKNWLVSKNFCKRMMCSSVPSFESYVNEMSSDLASLDGIDPLSFLDQSNSYCYDRVQKANQVPSSSSSPQEDYAACMESDIPAELCDDLLTQGSSVSSGGRTVYAPDGRYPQNFLEEKVAHKDTVAEYGFGPHELVVANFLHNKDTGKTWAEAMSNEWCEEEYLYEYGPSCWMRNPYKDSLCMSFSNNKDAYANAGAMNALKPICEDDLLGTALSTISSLESKMNFCTSDQRESYVVVHGEDTFWVNPQPGDSKDVRLLRPEGVRLSAREEASGLVRITDPQDIDQLREYGTQQPLGMSLFNNLNGCPKDDPVAACHDCAAGTSNNACCPEMVVGRRIPPSIAGEICSDLEPTSANIINPTSNFIDSTACVCLSGINAYLRQISDVSRMLGDCFETILQTGDGNAGVCQQLVSTYVCDLVYSAMGCFTEYAGTSFDETEDDGFSFRNIGDALALAGRRTQDRIAGEYDDTALFNHLFVEKNFINSVCNFALFGEWPSNFFETAFETAVDDVPIRPVMYCSGSRRFQTFDATTGVATHMYDLASFIRSGAPEATYKVELLCSTEHGSDCNTVGEMKKIDVTSQFGSGRLARSQTLDTQQFILIDESRDHVNQGWYRYDKLRLSLTYEDNDGSMVTEEQTCSLREDGGQAPAFCGFDVLDARFICRVVGQEGSVYFAQNPRPRRSVIYLDESYDDRMVEFDTYSVRVMSRPGQPLPNVRLRISITDNNGDAVLWTGGRMGEGRSSEMFRITSQDLIRLGSGADTDNLDIPKFVIEKIDAFGGGTGRCGFVYDDGSTQTVYSCEGNFDALRFDHDEATNIVTFQKGTYTNNEFTPSGSQYELTQEQYENCAQDTCNIVFSQDDLNFRVNNYRVLGGSFDNKFPFVIVNAHAGRALSRLDVKFSLIDESGSIIQEKTSEILIRSGTRAQDSDRPIDSHLEEDDDSRWLVGHEQICTANQGCICGDGVCDMGQKCCGVDSIGTSGIGYCIPSSAQCDDLVPNLNDLEVTISERNGFIDFNISRVKDESQTIEGMAPSLRLFVDLIHIPSDTSEDETELPSLQPRSESSFTTSTSNPQPGEANRYVRTYEPMIIPVVINRDGCYNVYISAVDQGGNYNPRLPESSYPNGILILEDGASPSFRKDWNCQAYHNN